MKITKRELRKIIEEERQKMVTELNDPPGEYTHGEDPNSHSAQLERAIYGLLGEFMEEGMDEDFAASEVVQRVRDILGI